MSVAAARDRPLTATLACLVLGSLLALAAWTTVGWALGHLRFGAVDFKAYYLAGLRVRAGVPLYETGAFVERVPKPRATAYLYPPGIAVAFAPLSVLPFDLAYPGFVLAQVGLLWGGLLLLAQGYGYDLTRGQQVLTLVAVVGFQAVSLTLRIGNVATGLAGLLCLSAAVTVTPQGPDCPYLAGALAALAIVVKPYAAPAGAHLLSDRRRLVGAAAGGGAVAALGLLAFGPETHLAYLDVLTDGKGWGPERAVSMPPWHYRPLLVAGSERLLAQSVLLLLVGVGVLLAHRRPHGDGLAFALGSVAVPLAAPTATTLTLAFAVPGLLVAALSERDRRHGRLPLVLGAVLAVQVSVRAGRWVSLIGPKHLPGLPWVYARSVFVVQPATVGLLAVAGLLWWRALAPGTRSL